MHASRHPLIPSRRRFLQTGIALGGVATLGRGSLALAADGPFTLPPLPYGYDALAPVIDEKTMTIHHDKHHQGYVNKLNAAVAGEPSLAGKSVEDLLANLPAIPEPVRTAVRNNGGGHANHTLFWTVMRAPREDNAPAGTLAEAIAAKFGSVEKFQEAFSTAAAKQFGSGWAWLVLDNGTLKVTKTANADLPLAHGQKALLTMDVWEHAYYLDYQNRRPDYITTYLEKLVNWDFVAANFAAA